MFYKGVKEFPCWGVLKNNSAQLSFQFLYLNPQGEIILIRGYEGASIAGGLFFERLV